MSMDIAKKFVFRNRMLNTILINKIFVCLQQKRDGSD
jgi:hypothetical protein